MELKGILHIHSNHSYDGKESLFELKKFLQRQGLSFAFMTEHTDDLDEAKALQFIKECEELSDDKFVFVTGFEVPYKRTHVLMVGSKKFICAVANGEELRSWRANSALAILAHPVRNDFLVDDDLLAVIDGVEIWNQQYEGKRRPRYRSMILLRNLRKQKSTLLAVGGVDFHRLEHFGSPLITIDIPSLSTENLLLGLKAGQYRFGHDNLNIRGEADWHPSLGDKFMSLFEIGVINGGKFVNKSLAKFGLALPRSLRRFVRRLV